MKKCTSLILIISLLLPLVMAPLSASANDTVFLVAKSYNNETTGAVPEGAVVKGGAKVVVTKEGKEKAVELSHSKLESGILYNITSEENNLNVFFDIEYKGAYSQSTFYVVDSSNKSFTIATLDTNGEICSGDNCPLNVMPKDRKVSVQISYNKKYKKASIFVDGKCLTENRYLGSLSPKTVAGFGISVKGNTDARCLVDNFAIFEGYTTMKSSDIPKEKYSSEFVDYSSDAEEEEVIGDTIYINRTFDETDGRPEFENIMVKQYDNRITVEQSVFDDNKYIRIDKRGTKQGFISYGASGTSRYIVAQADFSTDMYTPSSQLFFIRDEKAANMFCALLDLEASTGRVTTRTGLYVCTIKPLKWVNVAVVTDSRDLTYDVYVDRQLVHENVPFTNKTITGVPMFRTGCNATKGTGTLLIDNLRTYDGDTIREFEETERKSVIIPESYAVSLLGKMKAFEPYGNHLFSEGKKFGASHNMKVELDSKIIYAHQDDLKAVFGDSVKLTSQHNEDAAYYDVQKTGEASGYLFKNVDTRLFLFSNSPINLTDSQLDEVRRHMFHDRPSKEQLWENFEKTSKDQHPRILINQNDIDRIKELYKTDPVMNEWGDEIIKTADSWFGREEYTYYQDVGEINPFMCMMFAYHLTGDERYVARAWKFMENICLLPDWNPQATFLDVAELSFTVGLGYDWLYNHITSEQRAFLAKNLLEKGVELFHQVYFSELNDTGWYVTFYNATNNWGAVTNGGVMCGAMAILEEYPDVCLDVIYSANRCLEYMTGSYYPYGSWEEGVSYWRYALKHLNYAMLSMEKTFGTSYGLHYIPGLSETGWYGSMLNGATGIMTMGDTVGGFVNNNAVMAMATRYRDSELMATRLNEMQKYGYGVTAYEFMFYDPALNQAEAKTSLDSYVPGMEVLSLREAWFDKTATYLGASGGANKRPHGHMDIGSFVVDMSGERFISDVGGEDYFASGGYFTKNRYYFYAARPEGHNLYIINPEEDNIDYLGQDAGTAKAELLVSKPKGAIGRMDLSDAYKTWANSAVRGFMLSDDRRSVTVRDEIDLKGDDNYIYWLLHTHKDVDYLERNTLVLNSKGKKIQITVDCDAPDWTFELVPSKTMSNVTTTIVKDTNKESQNYKTFAVKVNGASGKVNISAKFKPYDDLMIDPNPTELDIDEWTIADGEVTPLPVADMIYVDGKPIENYDQDITGYSILVPNKETKVPEVTVSTTNHYEIIPAKEIGYDTLVKVYSPKDPSVYRTYRINFYKTPPLADIDGMRRYPVADVTCIESYEKTSPPSNVIDQNFGTRWASEGNDQWITLELDDVYPIEKVGISWMSGDVRMYNFKLEFSEDGITWNTVYNGSSVSGKIGLEYTSTGGKRAKYVRYTGYGNSLNAWNSVTEIAVLGNER